MLDTAGRSSDRAESDEQWMGLPLFRDGSAQTKRGGVFVPAGSESRNERLRFSGTWRRAARTRKTSASGARRASTPSRVCTRADRGASGVGAAHIARNSIRPRQSAMVIKDRIGNVLWETIPNLEQAISEELCPLCMRPKTCRGLAAHPLGLLNK